jgi:hypothetical protein
MTRTIIPLGLILCSVPSFALAQPGAITGMVLIDGPIADATVEATNAATGEVFSAITDVDGYTLSGLPAGTYEIAVPPLGWKTLRFVQPDVVVAAGETQHLDIKLELGNEGVIGDDLAFLSVRNRMTSIEGAAPRLADGTPSFAGVWQADVDPNEAMPDLLPWAAEEMDRRNENFGRDSPEAACLPAAMAISPTFYRFVQSPDVIVELFEYQGGPRQIFVDGRRHPADLESSWMGHSIGHWEGDTLVVDTVGFNDRSWLWNNYPHTDQLHLVERYTRTDLGHLKVDVTVEDPGALASPWDLHMTWRLAPGEEVLEYVCNENNQYFENIGAE